uniref:ATP/GTP binding protein-like 4 n=1 Tax=Nothobranchius furzeri TaxID=105023 RepID=A0A8C6Q703_NOTFU
MEENTVRDVEAGSETGEEDALVGNINKLMVTPPGYAGIPRKGHLVFDACFESGNLGHVDYISDFEFDLFIRPDTCNPRFRLWFNFTVENVRETQRVVFNFVNFSKTKSLYRDGMSPVVKSTSRPKCVSRWSKGEWEWCNDVGCGVCQAAWCIQWGGEQGSVMKCCHPRGALTSVLS